MRRQPLVLGLLVLFAALVTLILDAPANWLAKELYGLSDGQVTLADASGTIWHGSAVLSLSGTLDRPGASLALPGRVAWQFSGLGSKGMRWNVEGESLILPVEAEVGLSSVKINAGTASLPCELLDTLGGALQTLQLRCQASIGWQTLSLPVTSTSQNQGTVTLQNLTSALSVVRPLGDYQLDWHQNATGVGYTVATQRGPLEITGQGSEPGGFKGEARIASGTPPEVAERLRSLLATLGPSGPNGTLLQY
jgi:general secretion pathway protein N